MALVPKNGNDVIFTPPALAAAIVNHFNPTGKILEPCRGAGAFADAMPGCDWCELSEGKDFLTHTGEYDWIVTNPPWSKLRLFLNKSMELSDNVVFLCLVPAFFQRAKYTDIQRAGFSIVEIAYVNKTPPKPWPTTGFCLGAVHVRREFQPLQAIEQSTINW